MNIADKVVSSHYLSRGLSKVPGTLLWRAVKVAFIPYILFVLIASLTEVSALTSFLHVWQINFSFTIFLGLWFGSIALKDVEVWLIYIRDNFGISDADFREILDFTLNGLRSRKSTLIALPFIVGGLLISVFIALTLPSQLFPFRSFSPPYIYAVMIELCIVMLHLLAATGFWLLYILTVASKRLSETTSIDYSLVNHITIKQLYQIILKLCNFLLLIIASLIASIAFVGSSFGNQALVLTWIFGVSLPILCLVLSYFGPAYYINRLYGNAKEWKSKHLFTQLRICEDRLGSKIIDLSDEKSTLDDEVNELQSTVRYLQTRIKEIKDEREGPFGFQPILKLFRSASVPTIVSIISFFIQGP